MLCSVLIVIVSGVIALAAPHQAEGQPQAGSLRASDSPGMRP